MTLNIYILVMVLNDSITKIKEGTPLKIGFFFFSLYWQCIRTNLQEIKTCIKENDVFISQ